MKTTLSLQERTPYRQVHPLKIAIDVITLACSMLFLSRHLLAAGLVTMWIPSMVASALLIRLGNFSRTRASRTGAFLRRDMSAAMQGVRLAGAVLMATGAWFGSHWPVAIGVAAIACGWLGKIVWRQLSTRSAGAP
jgi:hypothetical protein